MTTHWMQKARNIGMSCRSSGTTYSLERAALIWGLKADLVLPDGYAYRVVSTFSDPRSIIQERHQPYSVPDWRTVAELYAETASFKLTDKTGRLYGPQNGYVRRYEYADPNFIDRLIADLTRIVSGVR